MSWEHVASGVAAALVAIAAIRRWRRHTHSRDIHIEWHFDWHARQRDESKEDDDHDGSAR